jgi:hypothetical protein
MKTGLEEWNLGMPCDSERDHEWAAICATGGAAVWAGLAVLARMGIVRLDAIGLLFLLAPLVIVPLGAELGRVIHGGDRFQEWASRLQPAGAVLAVVALWLPPGMSAGLAAIGWLLVCALMAVSGAAELGRALWAGAGGGARVIRVVMGIARLDLFVGGAWLVASRWGLRPMGIQEPIGLLTAVHFHFAGFASAMIAASTLRFAERREELPWLKYLALVVATLPIVVAAGFVISPWMKMSAAVLFSVSVAVLAIVLRACGRNAENSTARVLLQAAAGAVLMGMMFSGAYAVADYLGKDSLTIPRMASTHGVLNAVGFCLCGLLGWLVESSGQR